MAALPPPPQPPSLSPTQVANAVRPTVAIQAPVPPPLSMPKPGDKVFPEPAPNWARSTMLATPSTPDQRALAAANEPTARPSQVDLAIESIARAESGAVAADSLELGEGRAPRKRSRLAITLWIVVGVVVIGGGVFAGFQIRAMRLQKQIAAARDHATDLAKADTWTGWTSARDSLAGIVQASGTPANRAALVRARALIAYEFGDGAVDAKAAVDALAGQGGLDGDLAAAYLALAQSDPKAAKTAADAALATAPQDAAALYVAGQAALLAGDPTAAVKYAKDAFDKEARPLYGVGLARARAATGDWGDALAAIKLVLNGSPDQPAAVIERAMVLVDSGQIAGNAQRGNELHAQLEKVIAEGHKAVAEQPRGVSPAQIAFAGLALALVDFARNELQAVRDDIKSALNVGLDDQRFAETFVETVYALGDLALAQAGSERALTNWPTSRRARIVLAEIALAHGHATDALDLFVKQPDLATQPLGRAIRGQAYLVTGDLESARTDFDSALKSLPNLEPALVGRAWLDLATGAVDDARKRIERSYPATGASAAMTTVYAAILRRGGDRDKAKSLLEKVVAGPATADTGRAQLELARADRDLGDFKAARTAYSAAAATGNVEARLENGLLMIEDRDPNGGRDTLDELFKQAGDHPPPQLVLETARARMLVGDHAGAAQLLDLADKLPGVVKWQLLRERGRLALRRGDFAGAVTALTGALDGCGDDAETFMLAADAAGGEDKSGLADKIKKLVFDRLKTRPEASIVSGKLLLAAGKDAEAEAAYRAAKENLKNEKAAARRIAQADFGLAVAAYNRQNDAAAKDELTAVLNDDPSIYDAYLFMADLLKDKKAAFEQAQQAVRYNPDYPRAWLVLGKLAAKNNDKRMLADAIGKLNALAPTGDEIKELQALRHYCIAKTTAIAAPAASRTITTMISTQGVLRSARLWTPVRSGSSICSRDSTSPPPGDGVAGSTRGLFGGGRVGFFKCCAAGACADCMPSSPAQPAVSTNELGSRLTDAASVGAPPPSSPSTSELIFCISSRMRASISDSFGSAERLRIISTCASRTRLAMSRAVTFILCENRYCESASPRSAAL